LLFSLHNFIHKRFIYINEISNSDDCGYEKLAYLMPSVVFQGDHVDDTLPEGGHTRLIWKFENYLEYFLESKDVMLVPVFILG
jgi:hypothetical protein